ncbi:MAG: hypothetical protein WD022_00805 [Balneolaceae bacterium]
MAVEEKKILINFLFSTPLNVSKTQALLTTKMQLKSTPVTIATPSRSPNPRNPNESSNSKADIISVRFITG